MDWRRSAFHGWASATCLAFSAVLAQAVAHQWLLSIGFGVVGAWYAIITLNIYRSTRGQPHD